MAGKFNEDRFYSLKNAEVEPKRDNVMECLEYAVKSIYREAVRRDGINPQLKTIVADLEEIRLKSQASYDTVRLIISMYPTSYGEVAKARGVSKVAVYNQFKKVIKNYPWAQQIFELMSQN